MQSVIREISNSRRCRSADWQSAVSPTGSRQACGQSYAFESLTPAGCQPAIQQTPSLRYDSGVRSFRSLSVAALLIVSLAQTFVSAQTLDQRQEPPQQRRGGRGGAPERGVYKARINATWFQDNTRFWYRND